MGCSAVVKYSVIISLGVILCAVGVVLFPVFSNLIHSMVSKSVVIKTTSPTYEDWVDAPADIYAQYWIWDLMNKNEVENGEKPYVVQRGPYSYREIRIKTNMTFYPKNGTVSYYQPTSYIFDPKTSCDGCTENDKITTINIVLLYVATLVENEPAWLEFLLDIALLVADEKIFSEYTVSGILWGYDEPLIKMLKNLTGIDLPDKIGVFSGVNNSIEANGLNNVFTGETDVSKVNIFDNWNGSPNLTWWTTAEANMINGTDGSMFPPFMDKNDPIYLYSTDICRSAYLTYEKEESLKGVPLLRYTIPKAMFEPGTKYPPNEGFCTPDLEHCLKSGLLNISNCKLGIPIVISSPHFYNGDPSLLVGGMNPNKEEHQTFLDIDPITGAPMRLSKRVQLNIYAKEFDFFVQTIGLKEQVYPILWLNESSLLTDDAMSKYQKSVVLPLTITKAVKYGLIALGGFIILLVIIILTVKGCNKMKTSTPETVNVQDERSPLLGSQ